jgi:D-alanyl-D-alanine carboxypeptidase/D-alanyl-D-alanine-endopeptidase (penicillin-binding protein 4)
VRNLIAALPVAAWSGTLASRYVTGSARAGAGLVRAKTGTLTGVSALAGTVHDRSGELLAFAFIADRAADKTAAEPALDAIAARLAGCGCG